MLALKQVLFSLLIDWFDDLNERAESLVLEFRFKLRIGFYIDCPIFNTNIISIKQFRPVNQLKKDQINDQRERNEIFFVCNAIHDIYTI